MQDKCMVFTVTCTVFQKGELIYKMNGIVFYLISVTNAKAEIWNEHMTW